MPAEIGEPLQLDAVVLAKDTEVAAQLRTFAAPAADADVDVVALREDPAVPAGHGTEFEHERPAPPSRRKLLIREVALERDAVELRVPGGRLRRCAPRSAYRCSRS